jgi:uncharacterized protein YejL (UPF0352 family)
MTASLILGLFGATALVLQRQFCVRTALTLIWGGNCATFVLTQSVAHAHVSL